MRIGIAKQLDRAALGVHEHFAVAADSQQLLLVGALDPGLADHAGPEIAFAVDAREIVLADRADVAERVRADRAVGVMARHAGFEQDARQFVPVDGIARDFLVVELEQEGNGLERAARQHELAHARDVARIEQPESRQPAERDLEIAGLLAHDLELVGGRVLGDDAAGAVVDHAAVRRQRLDARAIALRQLDIVRVLDDLEPERAAGKQERDDRDDARREQRTLEEHSLFEGVVLDAHAPHGIA